MIRNLITACISRHLLIAITLAFTCGIALARQPLFLSVSSLAILIILAAILAILLFCILRRGSQVYNYLLIVLLFFLLGWYHCATHLKMPGADNHLYNLIQEKQEVVLVGTMANMAEFDGKTSTTIVKVRLFRKKSDQNLSPATGKIQLRLAGPWPESAGPGDELIIRAAASRPALGSTPGIFDYASFLAEQDIWTTGFLRSPAQLKTLKGNDVTWTDKVLYGPERIRTRLGKWLDGNLSKSKAAMYRALLIGDQSKLDDSILEIFRRTGTFHILSISGLHMSILAFIIYGCFYWLLSRSEWLLLHISVPKTSLLLAMPTLILYSTITGMDIPVIRALLMSCVVIFAFCSNRPKSMGPLIAFALMAILSIQPLQLFSASFLLSFSAIAAIAYLYPALSRIFMNEEDRQADNGIIEKSARWVIAAILVSISATLVTLPILIYFFNRLTLIGPAANVIFEPLICLWSLPLGFAGAILIPVSSTLGELLFTAGSAGFELAVWLGKLAENLPGSDLRIPGFSWWTTAGYFLGLFSLASGKKNITCLLGCVMTAGFGMIGLFLPALTSSLATDSDSCKITYFDVGQGSAALVEFPSRYRILIDGGSASFSGNSIGEKIIAPYLLQRGITKIDAIINTHPDADHFNGLSFVIRHFSPDVLWVKDRAGHNEEYGEMIDLAQSLKVQLITPQPGDRIGDDSTYLQCLANFGDNETSSLLANNSLVLKTCHRGTCTIFPGDIEQAEETLLAEQGINLRASFLAAPHHGSATSSSERFLRMVQPEMIFISAGKNDRRYFPAPSTTARYEELGITHFNTAEMGTMEMEIANEVCSLTSYRHIDGNPLLPLEKHTIWRKPLSKL